MIDKKKAYFFVCLLGFAITLATSVHSQPPAARVLERTVYRYNNSLKYDSAKLAISDYLNTPGVAAEDKYYGFLFLSYTYKRLFDYASTMRYLDSAQHYGALAGNPSYFLNNIACEKAYAFFDTHQYEKATTLMQGLHQQKYAFLNDENKSKIFMQEAYIDYLRKRYYQAERRYQLALSKMEASSPCDVPMIYGKLIELYSAMQNYPQMEKAYQKAVASADSCGIIKYHLYANEMMAKSLEHSGLYKQAIHYTHRFDSLNQVYHSQTYRNKLLELEAQFQNQITQQQLNLQQNTIWSKNLLITLLLVGIAAGVLIVLLYLLRLRQQKLYREKQNMERYTAQLLHTSEAERKRIAGHLHDGINHELLTIKNILNADNAEARHRIDALISDVRDISHNLHPIVFKQLGLTYSIIQLTERVQVKNDFLLKADLQYSKGLSPEAELQLFRIVQEAVTNIIKHADAVAGKIVIQQLEKEVLVEIKDNGKGFPVTATLDSKRAFGLHNIMERSRAIGGKTNIRSGSGGTTITIKIPLKQP